MLIAAKIFLSIAILFTALGLVSAVMVSRPREPRAGRRHFGSAGRRSPYADMPGFSRGQLEAIARRPVELHHASDGELPRSAAGSGTVSSRPMPLPANFNGRRLFGAAGPKPPFGRGRRAF